MGGTSSVISFIATATDDNPFKLLTMPFWCSEANIHIIDQDARYGDIHITSSYPSIGAGNGISFEDFDLNDVYFMNSNAGFNTTIIAICVVMTDKRKAELGLCSGLV